MAREIVNRQVSIYIESGQAQRVYDALIKKQKTFNDELATATNAKRIEKLKSELQKLEEPISRAAKKLSGELDPSLKDVQATATRLRNELARMSAQDAGYSERVKQYAQANKELEAQRGKVGLLSQAWKSFWQEAKTVAVGVIVGNTIQSALQTVMGYVTGIVTGSAKIADELADIEKTTNLTTEQVKQVNRELGKLDTRTSRAELRLLAVEAGKLGNETVEDVVKFVAAADKIKVALGDALGENAINDIAKTSKIYKEEILNIASAINEIGNRSEASEAFSVDFLKRLAGTAPTVRLAADEVLGYSAALEIAGQTTEVSSTALNTFFLDFVANVEKFGKAAGFAKGELANILNTQGTNEAFLQFLQRLKESSTTTSGFINKLKDLGIDGARGSNVMLALANNIKTVREQQLIANEAIKSNSSIMNEFTKKNNNAAAELDKFRKNFAGIFTSQSFLDAGAAVIRFMNSFINVLKATPEFIRENRFALLTLLAGILLLNKAYITAALVSARDTAAKAINTIVTRTSGAAATVAAAAQAAYAVVINLVTGRITLATAAQRLWNIALSLGAGPLGVILVAAGALAVAIGALLNRTKSLTTEQKLQAELAKRVAEATTDTVTQTQIYVNIAGDEKRSLEDKKKALDALIKQSPDVLKGLTLQNIKTAEGTAIINKYVEGLKKQAEAEAKLALFREETQRKAKLLTQIRSNVPELAGLGDQALLDTISERIRKSGFKGPISAISVGGVDIEDLVEVGKTLKILEKDIENITVDSIKPATDATADLTGGMNKLSDGLEKTSGKAKKTKDDIAELAKELKKIGFELDLETLNDFDKELAQLDAKYGAFRARAKGNVKLLKEIDELYYIERINLIEKFSLLEQEANDKKFKDDKKAAEERAKKIAEIVSNAYNNTFASLNGLFEKINRDRLAAAELKALQSSGKKRLEAELAYLQEQKRQELSNKDLTENEKLLIEQKYRDKSTELEGDYWRTRIQIALDFLSQAASIGKIFGDAKTQQENAELERDRNINDKKKKNLDARLKAGTISQQVYDRELQKIEKEQERREKEARVKQFKRDQRQQLVAAGINAAGAVLTTLEKFGPPIPPNFLGIAAMGLTVLTSLANIATIARQKPPEFGRGGKLGGRSHADGGNPILDGNGRVIGNIEHDEGIINKFSMRDRRKYTVTGTPSQIASEINGLGGRGVRWTSGATLRPAWTTVKPQPMNFAAIQKYYATGGVFNASATGTSDTANNEMLGLMLTVMQNLQLTIEDLNGTLARGIKAPVVLSELEEQQDRLAAIKKDAAFSA